MDFFVGYNWPVDPDLWRFVRRAAVGLGVGVVGLSGVLAVGHRPLDGGAFEFGNVTEHAGTIVEHPVPMLRRDGGRWPLLVGMGKHGAEASIRGRDGEKVVLRATRISRGDLEMLELAGAAGLKPRLHTESSRDRHTVRDVAAGLQPRTTPVTLVGEIVDSKCFLGVMVPGAGTTHRGCAALCLRGGIPAALHVREADGTSTVYLIVGSSATHDRAVQWAGETVEMTGTLTRQGGWPVLTTEPGSWRRHER
jgi:hypothetical protein